MSNDVNNPMIFQPKKFALFRFVYCSTLFIFCQKDQIIFAYRAWLGTMGQNPFWIRIHLVRFKQKPRKTHLSFGKSIRLLTYLSRENVIKYLIMKGRIKEIFYPVVIGHANYKTRRCEYHFN